MRTTKIVATLGPASSSAAQIRGLIQAGASVLRLNFSHGSHAEHAERIAQVRACSEEVGEPVALLLDLQGPKIRTGGLAAGGPVELTTGAPFAISTRPVPGDASGVSTTYAALGRDVREGDRILLSDGLIELEVVKTSDERVDTRVINGGALKESQGINLPGVVVSAPGITEKDEADLRFGVSQGVDFVALSFVRSAEHVAQAKRLVAAAGGDQPIVAKIERPEAIERISEILDVTDIVMVARGDLGVEIPPERVPVLQKSIIAACNRRGIPVITATQMLESMIENPRPTRAEMSDVANAVLDGSDAVMLSGETAVGRFPDRAVATMVRAAREVHAAGAESDEPRQRLGFDRVRSDPEAIAAAVGAIVRTRDVDAVFVVTLSGTSARLVAQQRPPVPIIAFTPNEQTYRRMALLWGVRPLRTDLAETGAAVERDAVRLALEHGLVEPGQKVVFLGSHPFLESASTNFLKLRRI